jgi:hypothetical protein
VQQTLKNQMEIYEEESLTRHKELTESIDKLRVKIAIGGGSTGGGGAGVDPDDMTRWNSAATKVHSLEEIIMRLQREINQAELPKLKLEI